MGGVLAGGGVRREKKERKEGGREGEGSWEMLGVGRTTILQHDGFVQRNSLTVRNSSFHDCDNTNTFISLLKLTF